MSSTPPRYRLVIFDAIDDVHGLREMVCEVTGVHPTDAVQWLARAPGTWPQPLEDEAVRGLLDGLYQAGIAAEAWRVDQFPDLNPSRTVHKAACLAEGFRVEGLRGEPTHWVPWDRVELICAGRIGGDDEYRIVQPPRWPNMVVAGVRALALLRPRPSERLARAARIPRDAVGEVIVVRREPRVAFRAIESQMSYAYLGKRRRPSAAENFPIFVSDLCARADTAFITPSTRSLLSGSDDGEHQFASPQALLDYATHRLLWSWYRRDRDRASEANGSDRDSTHDTEPGTSTDTDLGDHRPIA